MAEMQRASSLLRFEQEQASSAHPWITGIKSIDAQLRCVFRDGSVIGLASLQDLDAPEVGTKHKASIWVDCAQVWNSACLPRRLLITTPTELISIHRLDISYQPRCRWLIWRRPGSIPALPANSADHTLSTVTAQPATYVYPVGLTASGRDFTRQASGTPVSQSQRLDREHQRRLVDPVYGISC
jgi:hypothetical protein